MKKLSLLRHAKSSWDDTVLRDFDRPLNPRGKKAAATMGQEARRLGLRPDRLVASPAARVTETLNFFFEGYGERLEPLWDQRLYLASSATLIDIIQETDDGVGHLMLAGHNPGLEDLILELVADDGASPLRDVVAIKYPTACLAQLSWDGSWSTLGPDKGATLDLLVRPRDLDPELGPDR